MTICKICKNTVNNKSYIVREMMFGYRDKFEYFKCGECGCLQINRIPDNLSKYYPKNYYSFLKPYYFKDGFLKSFLKHQRAEYCLYKKNVIGMLLTRLYKTPNYYNWFKKVKIEFKSEILDAGCGVGHLLVSMHKDGFSNLTGIDPFINDDIFYERGLKVFKKNLSELKQLFDFIILHDSFEHMREPLSVFKELYRMLKSNRYVLIKIPVVSSFVWRKYGINWVQLDAPRHLFLHTIKSIQILAGKAGFQIKDVVFDSTEFQFWGSEQYLRDIPLRAENSYVENPRKSIFSKEQINSFKTKAAELNKNNDGDSACFYLYKSKT